MDGIRVVTIAFLLCLVPLAGVTVASDTVDRPLASGTADEPLQTDEDPDRSMTVVAVDNTSEYLAPPSERIDRTEKRTVGIDAAGAIEADAAQLRSNYRYESLRAQYRDAEADAERAAVLEGGTDEFVQRVDSIEAKETNAIRQFNQGEASEHELLRTLSTTHHEAESARVALEWLEEAAEELGDEETADRAATERVRLVPRDGPVRALSGDALAGESTPRIYVETADDGVVLAAIDPADDTYLREAYDPTAKRDDVSDQYDGNPSPALDRFGELYPWSINSFDAIDAIGPAQVRLYRFGASHPHGQLETYLDSGSTEILYEKQRLNPASVPTTTSERTEGDLRLLVDTTRAGGPIGVSVVDTTTGEPVDATVEINEDPVGSTGGGQLWTVAPREITAVNATHDGETVSLRTFLD